MQSKRPWSVINTFKNKFHLVPFPKKRNIKFLCFIHTIHGTGPLVDILLLIVKFLKDYNATQD